MKARNGYVSNSSSSSFLVPREPNGRSCIRLSDEIWRAIWRNHVEWDGRRLDMSCSDEWWLTDMVSECDDAYSKIADSEGAIPYLEGNDMPYGCYEEDGNGKYIRFRKDNQDFYVLMSDFIGRDGKTDIPESVVLRDKVKQIMGSRLNKTQKLDAIGFLFDF